MHLTFIVPPSFTVFNIPQRERPPCLIECEVVELVRERTLGPWRFRNSLRRSVQTKYTAYVRLPAWVTPPERWHRRDTGEVALTVPLHLNPRAVLPQFPAGSDRVRFDDVPPPAEDAC